MTFNDDIEAAVCRTLLDMMETRALHHIRVTQLCTQAGVSRSTFYTRFRDAYDVLSRIVDTLLAEFDELAERVRENAADDYEVSLQLFGFFRSERTALRAILQNETSLGFLAELDKRIRRLHMQILAADYDLSRADVADVVDFANAGFYRFYLSLIWEDESLNERRIAQRARLAAEFCTAGLQYTLRQRNRRQTAQMRHTNTQHNTKRPPKQITKRRAATPRDNTTL